MSTLYLVLCTWYFVRRRSVVLTKHKVPSTKHYPMTMFTNFFGTTINFFIVLP